MTTTTMLPGDCLPVSTLAGLLIAAMEATAVAVGTSDELEADHASGHVCPHTTEGFDRDREVTRYEREASHLRQLAGLAA